VLELCRTALKTFEAIGCVVEEAVPDHPVEPVWQAFMKIRQWQSGGALVGYYRDPTKRALLKPEAVWEIEEGLKLSAQDVSAASVERSAWSASVRRLFAHYDYLVMPTAQMFPFAVEENWPRQIAGQSMRTYHEWMKAVCLITMSGCPSLAAPAGFNAAGLSMGLQIIAPVRGEMDCLRLAQAYEEAAPWTARRLPALLS
jgi:amidase